MTSALASKIAKAALEVGGKLNPDKRNKEQGYDYLSADKILSMCGQALFSQGLVVIPEVSGQEVNIFEYQGSGNQTKRRYDARVIFEFDITDGETESKRMWYGMGSDYSTPDKALYKAITSGHKYFLMKLLCIGAGNEDGEHEDAEPPARQQTKRNGNGSQPPTQTQQPAKANGNGDALTAARMRRTPKGTLFGDLLRDQLEYIMLNGKTDDDKTAAQLILDSWQAEPPIPEEPPA